MTNQKTASDREEFDKRYDLIRGNRDLFWNWIDSYALKKQIEVLEEIKKKGFATLENFRERYPPCEISHDMIIGTDEEKLLILFGQTEGSDCFAVPILKKIKSLRNQLKNGK